MHVGWGIQAWKVRIAMRGDGYACWVGYMSMEGLHGYEG